MPTIPVQTRLAPPAPAAGSNVSPPVTVSSANRAPISSAAPPIGPWSLAIGHSAPAPAGAAVSLRIDSLVLHGLPASEARRVSIAFEKELTRLLTESPLSDSTLSPTLQDSSTPASDSDPRSIGPWSLDIGHSGAGLGAGAARALHARLRA